MSINIAKNNISRAQLSGTNPLLTSLNNQWLRYCLDNPIRLAPPHFERCATVHLLGHLPFSKQSTDIVKNTISQLKPLAVGVWSSKDFISNQYSSVLKPFFKEFASTPQSSLPATSISPSAQKVVQKWERHFLENSIKPQQYLGTLLTGLPFMSELYVLSTMQMQSSQPDLIPLLSSAENSSSRMKRIWQRIDSLMQFVVDKGMKKEGLDFQPGERSQLHARLKALSKTLETRPAEKGSDQTRHLVNFLEFSSTVLSIEESRTVDDLFRKWQRCSYLFNTTQPARDASNSVLDYINNSPEPSLQRPILLITPRAQLFEMERCLRVYSKK